MNDQHTIALNHALAWVEDNFTPIGIIVSGSIIRGNANDNSDFDIYVIHKDNFRQRVQKRFNGTPCEIFVNNPAHIYRYFDSEVKDNRPVTANILSTGKIVMGIDNKEVQQILDKANEFVNKTPIYTDDQNLFTRYAIANLYEDATDLLETDSVTAAYFLDRTILACIDFTFLMHSTPLPRPKERITLLMMIQPELGNLVKEYYQSSNTREKYEIAGRVVIILVGESGFFEWSSAPE